MHDSYLVVTLGRNVEGGHTFVELFASDCEVLLKEVLHFVVVVGVDSGIFDDDESIFLKILGNILAVCLPVALLIKIIGDVYFG